MQSIDWISCPLASGRTIVKRFYIEFNAFKLIWQFSDNLNIDICQYYPAIIFLFYSYIFLKSKQIAKNSLKHFTKVLSELFISFSFICMQSVAVNVTVILIVIIAVILTVNVFVFVFVSGSLSVFVSVSVSVCLCLSVDFLDLFSHLIANFWAVAIRNPQNISASECTQFQTIL